MVKNKNIFIIAAIVTLMLLVSIYSFNTFLNVQRERAIIDRMEQVLDEYQELQTLSLMSNVFGRDMTCISLENSLRHMDRTLWETGVKIDKYRQATEEFFEDPFYLQQKTRFNRNEVLYLSMLQEMKEWCTFNQTTVLFFYKKKEDCPNCDEQSFVLTDLNKEMDEELAIFSFDSDLQLPSIQTLELFYNITQKRYPCTVIEEEVICGLQNRRQMKEALCDYGKVTDCS